MTKPFIHSPRQKGKKEKEMKRKGKWEANERERKRETNTVSHAINKSYCNINFQINYKIENNLTRLSRKPREVQPIVT